MASDLKSLKSSMLTLSKSFEELIQTTDEEDEFISSIKSEFSKISDVEKSNLEKLHLQLLNDKNKTKDGKIENEIKSLIRIRQDLEIKLRTSLQTSETLRDFCHLNMFEMGK
jgi:uncharacterized coiled-coil DUF342 family protein